MRLYHDSFSPLCRFPQGALPCLEEVTLRIQAPGATEAAVRFYDGSEKWFPMMRESDGWFSVRIALPDNPILCWYDFLAEDQTGRVFALGAPKDGLGGEGIILQDQEPRAWQITVYDPSYTTPEWMHTGVMYQIFPDRFYRQGDFLQKREECFYHDDWYEEPILMPEGGDSNCARDFFGGNLKGIEEKLPYLKDLGVTVLYLNPIFQARSNHRYDTADYEKIDPLLGDREAFVSLCRAAREAGIRIMLDGVFSHTGEDSVYFNRFGRYPTVGACQSTHSPYYPWYKFSSYPDRYACWWGIHTLPEVDKSNPSYQQFMFKSGGVVRQWIERGSSGWRLDVADELSMDFLRKLRRAVKAQDPQAVVLGEVWEDASHKVAYGEMRCYCQGDTLDSVMNYPLREAAIDFFTGRIGAGALMRLIQSQQANYPVPFYYALMNLAGSHDRARILNMLAQKTFENLPPARRRGKRLTDAEYARAAAQYIELTRLLCALPGIPCIYYGDEAGMQGSSDPFCRGAFPWGREDQALQESIRQILWRRRRSPAMQTGTLSLEAPDENTLRITRQIAGGRDVFGHPAKDETVTVDIKRQRS
ncbi:MAG: glycoside hydrolase family 13 protein [Clostridiales bacterium]|nr:glycoside hydrolase family 13 protein [Clostridiales bacterium]